ncbi:hypothetical protein JTB14_038149 [Gonioctena quinquepunctata]|nr:hypothetical protein JTB14_038149 [Gonioctena quinquepunctata]
MEEVDKIIIGSLENLKCNFGDDVHNLRNFDADMVVAALSSCLEVITPNTSFPKKLPPSMSARMKLALNLAQYIKELGFEGDMGYQTILYCNEMEIRNVLIFLIERLPRDTSKTIPVENAGYIFRIVQALEGNIKNSLEQIWVPSCFVNQGVREFEKEYILISMGGSGPLLAHILEKPETEAESEILKQHWVHSVPDVTKQCSRRNLIPSLLFKDIKFSYITNMVELMKKQSQTTTMDPVGNNDIVYTSSDKSKNKDSQIERIISVNIGNSGENKLNKLLDEFSRVKAEYAALQLALKYEEPQLSEVISRQNTEQDALRNSVAKLKVRRKTMAIASKKENLAKLKNLIKISNDRLVELANQWTEIQTPLLEEYKLLQCTITTKEKKIQEDQSKLISTSDTCAKLLQVLKDKTILEQNLAEKCRLLNRTNNRSTYTIRILEIIGNISKQNIEIQNILSDTRNVQRDINYLTGQVGRSFTLSDELIFYDAKNDETARRAYKLLAALRNECNSILKTTTDLGLTERECRNLEEQIEFEKSIEIDSKLERVYSDLAQIQKETNILMKHSQV